MRRSRYGPRVLVGLAVALHLLTSAALSAQVNVEALRQDDPPLGYSGSFGGDLTIRTGNVDLVQIGVNARLYSVTESATRLVVGNGGIGLLSGSRFASSGLLHYRHTYHFEGGISPEWWAQLNYDQPQLLDFRAIAGGGARTRFTSGEWGQVGMGVGLMAEHERLDLPDTAIHDDQTTVIRWSSFVTLRLIPSESLVITSTTYIQPEFGAFSDLRALENLRVAVPVTDRLELTVSFDLRYDSRPPDLISALDTSLRAGARYTY